MSASPALMGTGATRGAHASISSRWRTGQIVLTALIALLAVYYNVRGWQNPAGELPAPPPNLFDQVGFLVLAGLVWLSTPAVWTLASTTFHEAIRRRWMSALLVFALVMLALSTFFTFMQPGEQEKFLRDFGIGFTIIITMLMAIFLGVALVPPEIERRTIFTILSKPVDRIEFLLGKYFGLCLTLLLNLTFMSVMFLISYVIFRARQEGLSNALIADPAANHPGLMFDLGNLARALALQFGQLMVLAALSLTLSLLISGIAAIVFSFLAYFAGQTASYWEHLSGNASAGGATLSGPLQSAVRAVYFLLPRLDRFDVRERLINNMPIAFSYEWRAFGSGLTYVAVLLTIAYFVFSDREF